MDNTLYTIEGDRIIVDVDNCSDEEYMDEKNWMTRSSVGIMCRSFMPIPREYCELKTCISDCSMVGIYLSLIHI